jgi:hypothetical protein
MRNTLRLDSNKDVISVSQDFNKPWIPSLLLSHVAPEHSLHPVGIVWLNAGVATKANVLNQAY